jgi:hydrogenase expression/formation protein HypD
MDKNITRELADELKTYPLESGVSIMEVCGTHTTEYFRTGVKDLFPAGLRLVDGPGCPVCVTPNEFLDRAIAVGKESGVVITTFGDMMKVPSSYSSLSAEKAGGMKVEVIYSPMDAVELAEKNPEKEVVFLSVGFETTAPAEAVSVIEAKKRNIKNYSILPGNKLTTPAVKALLDAREAKIDGFILPGHVSAVIGADAWKFIAEEYGKPCVVAGFEDHDLIRGTLTLLHLIKKHDNILINEYKRVVRDRGNEKAQEIMFSVFHQGDSLWRGIGLIPGSGLFLKDEFADFDASKKFNVTVPPAKAAKGCRCGELLRGLILPEECQLFGKACVPEKPVGPCMVSSEGPCAAYYKYGRR